ncbi:unnamed protein product, partial [Symbiodinium sp. CCMP2456]
GSSVNGWFKKYDTAVYQINPSARLSTREKPTEFSPIRPVNDDVGEAGPWQKWVRVDPKGASYFYFNVNTKQTALEKPPLRPSIQSLGFSTFSDAIVASA